MNYSAMNGTVPAGPEHPDMELSEELYSCHNHKISAEDAAIPSLILLIPLFLCALGANTAVVYALRKCRHVIDSVLQLYCYVLATVDVLKVVLVILPAIVRLCNPRALSGQYCYAGYWINLFTSQSSLLLLSLAAYDRVMVLRRSEGYGYERQRWKNIVMIGCLIPMSYMLFDVIYTKVYEANVNSAVQEGDHGTAQMSLCFDQKLGWCTTKSAPHEHEKTGKSQDLSGSKKAGVFICQAHIMTVLMLISLVTLQSGHANYKKLYNDESHEGGYYLMILALNMWLYLPAMFGILIDTFTASVFPTAYYEEFYIYLYITPLMPCVLNSGPLFIAYREYIFKDEQEPPKNYQALQADHKSDKMEMDEIYRRISRLEIPVDFSSFMQSPMTLSPLMQSADGSSSQPSPRGRRKPGDKSYFDTADRERKRDMEITMSMLRQMYDSERSSDVSSEPDDARAGLIATAVLELTDHSLVGAVSVGDIVSSHNSDVIANVDAIDNSDVTEK